MQVRVRMWVLVLASVASLVSGQQAASSSRIQALVSQLAAAPRHHSPSPSYSSDRRISVDQVSCDWSSVVTAPSSHQGVGGLPLQERLGQPAATKHLPFLEFSPQPVTLTDRAGDSGEQGQQCSV